MTMNTNHLQQPSTALRVLSAGMGRQCSAILALVEQGRIQQYDLIVFADTKREPADVYANIRYWRARGHDITVVSAGDLGQRLDILPLFVNGKRKNRQCTRQYKIKPIHDAILDTLLMMGLATRNARGDRRVRPGVRVQQAIGFSRDEMYRVKRESRNPGWLVNEYPLVDLGMTAWDCVSLLNSLNHPVVKSSCIFCPYVSDSHLRQLQPHQRAEVVLWDERLRSADFVAAHPKLRNAYLHRSGRPMADVLAHLDSLPTQLEITGWAYEALESCEVENANCMT